MQTASQAETHMRAAAYTVDPIYERPHIKPLQRQNGFPRETPFAESRPIRISNSISANALPMNAPRWVARRRQRHLADPPACRSEDSRNMAANAIATSKCNQQMSAPISMTTPRASPQTRDGHGGEHDSNCSLGKEARFPWETVRERPIDARTAPALKDAAYRNAACHYQNNAPESEMPEKIPHRKCDQSDHYDSTYPRQHAPWRGCPGMDGSP